MPTRKRTRNSTKSTDANSSQEQATKKTRARSKSSSNDDDKEFLFLDEPASNIFEEYDMLCKGSVTANKKSGKQGKVEMKIRICGLTGIERNRVMHYIIPAFNTAVTPTKSYNDLQRYPSLDVTAPSAIYVAAGSCPAVDICHQRTRVYDHYKNLLYSGRTRYLNQLKKNISLAALEQKDNYSNHVFNFAERYNADPDPYFFGCYDYYYTGGNLCALPQRQYILHAQGDNLENLLISTYNQQQQRTQTISTQTYDAQNSEIFEVREFPANFNHECLYTVRQRTELTVSNFNGSDTQTLYSFKAKVPFISTTHIPNYKQHLLTSNMCQQLRLYDLDEGEARIVEQYNLSSGIDAQNHSWNMLRAYDEHAIVYANEQEIYLMDPRTTKDEWLRTTCRETHAAFSCERITCLAVSHTKPYLYVTNTHHLHTLDLRKLESDLREKSAICTWTHQMHYPAAFMDTLNYNGMEYIALASAVAGEVRICEAGHKELEFSATSLPYQPPTLKEAYYHAKLSGRCLQAAADLPKRVALCTTGLTFYASEAQAESEFEENTDLISQLLVSNSIGDVFAYNLLEKQQEQCMRARVNEQSAQKLQNYAARICSNINPVLQYTDVCNMPGIKKALRCRNLSEGCVLSDEFEQKTNPRRLGRWQKSFAALKQFKDALAQDLLSIWDVNEQPDQTLNMTLPEEQKHDMSTDAKVNNWLNIGTLAPPPMTTIYLPQAEVTQQQQQSENLIDTIILPDNTLVNFEFLNQEQEIEFSQASVFPLGQIIQTEQLETSTPNEKDKDDARKQLNLVQLFSRRNSQEDITSIPASSERTAEAHTTEQLVHIQIPASATSTAESERIEWVPKRAPTPARIKPTLNGNEIMELCVVKQEANQAATLEELQQKSCLTAETLENSELPSTAAPPTKVSEEDSATITNKQTIETLQMKPKHKDLSISFSDNQSTSSQKTKLKKYKQKNTNSDQSITSTVTSLKKKQKKLKKKQLINSCSDLSITSTVTSLKKKQKELINSCSDQSIISTVTSLKKKQKKLINSCSDQSITSTVTSLKKKQKEHIKSCSDQSIISTATKLKKKQQKTLLTLDNKISPITPSTQKKQYNNSLSSNASTKSSLLTPKTKERSNLITDKRYITQEKQQRISFMKQNTTPSPAKSKQMEFLTPNSLTQNKDRSSASDKSSNISGLKLLQKKKRNSQSSAEKISPKSPKQTTPKDLLKQTNFNKAFKTVNELSRDRENVNTTTLNRPQFYSTLNSTQLNSTLHFTLNGSQLNSTLNATALNKLNKVKKKKPKFKKYVKGF